MSFGFGFGFGFGVNPDRAATPNPVPDPVALTSGGSLRFPENNNETSIPGFRGFLSQPDPPAWFTNTAGAAAFAIVSFPKTRRVDNRNYRLFGNGRTGGNAFTLGWYGRAFNDSSLQQKFSALAGDYHGDNVECLSPVWTEDSALVVIFNDGTNFQLDWYSLADGTRHAGAPVAPSGTFDGVSWPSDWLIGGAGDSTTAVNVSVPNGYWPGEIAVLGHVSGNVPVADWQAIATGADPIATLGAANLVYYRGFDGSGDSYGPPAAVTADTSADCVPVDGQNLSIGSSFWRGPAGLAFATATTRFVHGLLPGETAKAVTFEGTAIAAHDGKTVEVQVFNAETGAVEKDWTGVGTIASSAWSGAVTVPQSSAGWVCARARLQTDHATVAWQMEPFAVGWKFAVIGQSQMQIAARSMGYAATPDGPVNASAGIRNTSDSWESWPWLELTRVRDEGLGDANVVFRKQFDEYGDNTPVSVCWYTENGTSVDALINDAVTSRKWSDFAQNAAAWGSDITGVLWNWGTSDLGDDWSDLFDACFDGVGPKTGDHALSDIFPAGFARILSPLTRATVANDDGPYSSDSNSNYNARYEQIAYADANGWTVGPHVYTQIGGTGGPHQDSSVARGNPRVGQCLAIAAARAVGLDNSSNPHLTGTASFNGAKTTITVPVTLPNGGTLTAAAPNAITGFEVDDGGLGSFTRLGFSAAIAGADIVLTRDSGSWAAGTKLRFMYGGPLSYGTAGPSETVLLDGVPHETYAHDYMGWGLPVDGLGPETLTVA